jgi:hypothetical protein
MRRTSLLTVCGLALVLCTVYAAAQTPADTLKVDYFSNANTAQAPDGTLRITNPGTSGGNLCAAIYVLDPMQEMSECCSCLLTPDGLRTLSVNTDLTSNPLTGVILTTGVVKILSIKTINGSCPTYPIGSTVTAGLRSWTTHIQTGFAITETASQDATLSSAEQLGLQNACHGIKTVGSGKGLCSCGTGD